MKTNDIIKIGGWQKNRPNDIFFLHDNSNYTTIYVLNGKRIFVATTLKKLHARFSGSVFFRTHKSFIVNMNYLIESQQLTNMIFDKEIVLKNDQKILL